MFLILLMHGANMKNAVKVPNFNLSVDRQEEVSLKCVVFALHSGCVGNKRKIQHNHRVEQTATF
jgi:hypothetical protein